MTLVRWPIDPQLGVNFDEVDSTQKHKLGKTVQDNLGGTMKYCLAGEALDQYALSAIDENHSVTEVATTDTGGTLPVEAVIPQIAVASGEYFWGWVGGKGASVLALASCAADVKLYTSATAGAVDDDASSTDLIEGLRLDATNGGSTAAVACSSAGPLTINAQD